MNDVVPFPEHRRVKRVEPNQDALDMARRLLAKIEAGEIEWFGFAALHADGSAFTGWSVGAKSIMALGVLDYLHARFRAENGLDR